MNKFLKKIKINSFSIVEILIVIVIVSILATIGHKVFLSYVMRGKITEAIKVLQEYQTTTMSQFQTTGTVAPYYILFPEGDETGWVSGIPAGTTAEKELNLKYVSTITAKSGTISTNKYILLGVGMAHDGLIVADADHVYMAAIITPAGVITWKCGISASGADTVDTKFLPSTCQESLP